jgi:hypothetical protein
LLITPLKLIVIMAIKTEGAHAPGFRTKITIEAFDASDKVVQAALRD